MRIEGWHGQVLLPVRPPQNTGKRVHLPMPPTRAWEALGETYADFFPLLHFDGVHHRLSVHDSDRADSERPRRRAGFGIWRGWRQHRVWFEDRRRADLGDFGGVWDFPGAGDHAEPAGQLLSQSAHQADVIDYCDSVGWIRW